jgi:biotin operon repressor
VIEFKIPKRPRIIEKEAPPDQRKFAVVPMAALTDERLHHLAIRVLGLVCSYANKAGITWVGQQRIADHLKITKQAVNKAIKQLKEAGYLEVMSKGFRGERADTLRIIYDPSIKAEDAIAATSGQEDTRPPSMAKKEIAQATQNQIPTNPPEEEFTEEQMAANRARLKELLGGLANRNGFHHNKPERMGDIMARKPKAKPTPKTPHIVNPQVDHAKGLHSQPMVNLQVDQTQKNIGIDKVLSIYENISKHRFVTSTIDEVDLRCAAIMCEVGVSEARFTQLVETMPVRLRLSEVCEQLVGEVTGC